MSSMSRYPRRLVVTIAAIAAVATWPAVANAQRVCWPGVTLPPVEIPAVMTHGSVANSPLEVSAALVRLSVGIEDPTDLLADLEQALR